MSKTSSFAWFRAWPRRHSLFWILLLIPFVLSTILTVYIVGNLPQFPDPVVQREQSFPSETKSKSKSNSKTNDDDALSPLYSNPFQEAKCRNALPELYGINNTILLQKTKECEDSMWSGVSTRENWLKLLDEKRPFFCPKDQRSAIRSHKLQIDHVVYQQQPSPELKWLIDLYPIYFMIAKSGSSSITSILRKYNQHFGYSKYGDISHKQAIAERVNVIHSPCSFTFVRDPVSRFIAGYYTVNAMLWDNLKGKDMI